MTREEQILNITQRKVAQGISAAEQYAALNKAREKRKSRRARNLKIVMADGQEKNRPPCVILR